MPKIIRLTESDLVRLVSRVINEQKTPSVGNAVPTSKPRTNARTAANKLQVPVQRGGRNYGSYRKIVPLDEALSKSLGRVLQHIQGKQNVKSWGIITAYRDDNKEIPNLNKHENKHLEYDLKKLGLGFSKFKGQTQECKDAGVPFDKCPQDRITNVTEESFFVPNISERIIRELGKKYKQESVLFGGEVVDGRVYLISLYDNRMVELGKLSLNLDKKKEKFYTELKGDRTFVFQPKEPKISEANNRCLKKGRKT